jgi:sortase A
MKTPDSTHAIASVERGPSARRLGRLFSPSDYLRWIEYACWIAAAVLLGWFLYVLADTLIFQRIQSHRLAALHRDTAAPVQLHTGELLGKLTIPSIGLSAVILEGDDDTTLRRAIGHIPGTSLPDGSGTVGLAGHRDTFFRNLGRLRPNEIIALETPGGTYHYRVASTSIVAPDSVGVLSPQSRPSLTLVTCYPFHYIGPAPKRYVVTAWRIPEAPTNLTGHVSVGINANSARSP